MKQYMLLPEDSIELLRAQDEAEAAVCVFCERTMILFPCSKIEAVSIQRSVTEDRLHPVNCLELLARDTLFDAQQAVLIPVTRQDYPDFLQALAGDGFDIVCANIVADVIIRLAPVVPKLMRPDAAFVCSGILTTREDDVRAALAASGLEIVHAAHEGEWCGLTARLGVR